MLFANSFEVEGRAVLITGGSSGMGLEVARQLAEKGANVAIVARNQDRLLKSLAYVQEGAKNRETQRFHQISADLTLSSEAVRVVDEVVAWNNGFAPDIVWCCAGVAHPTLFIDTPVEVFSQQMNSNYFTSLYVAHAILRHWLKGSDDNQSAVSGPARHLIFTASISAFYTFTGYTPYSPAKAALRSLSDTLSQEMNLYYAAYPNKPRVRLHTIFPATILSEGLENENKIKPDVTKLLEEVDDPLTPQVIASQSIKGLENGQELITTDFITGLTKNAMLGTSIRGGFLAGFVDWILACFLIVVMVFLRSDMDKKVQAFGRKFGPSGMKRDSSA
ncbi:hypothetical protein B0I35DRAFT_444931 [Stachybotrys elegans]|uniref:3-dehydrosphinganine reductase n=1 Tax=Stachybotrys elegans TaxID=80388 RepID=A0A8K0WKL9_9HYPO|nr:hypothetical protein B0I35DRAFT_444931 [Stachybotrys elegans]